MMDEARRRGIRSMPETVSERLGARGRETVAVRQHRH